MSFSPLRYVVLTLWGLALATPIAVMFFAPDAGLAGSPESGLRWGRFAELTSNSLLTSGVAAVLSVLLAIIPAIVAIRLESMKSRAVLIALAVMPLFISPSVVAVMAVRLLGAQGYATDLAYSLLDIFRSQEGGLRTAPIFSLGGVIFTLVWAYFPVSFLALLAAFARTDPAAEEAAILETGPFRALLRTNLGWSLPGIAVALVLTFLLCLTEFGIPEALRSQPVLVSEVYVQFGVYYDRGAAIGSAALMVVMALVVGGGFLRYATPGGRGEGELEEAEGAFSFRSACLSRLRTARLAGWAMACLPAVSLLVLLGITTAGPLGFWGTMSKVWEISREEFVFTILLCMMSAVACSVAGGLVGMALAGLSRPFIPRLLVFAGFLVPGPVYGVALKTSLLWPPGSLPFRLDDGLAWLDGTTIPLLFSYVLRFAPLVAIFVELALRRVPQAQREAVRLETGSNWAAFRAWMLPVLPVPIGAGFLGCFALVLAEVGATIILIPPGPATLSVRLMTLMHYAPTSQVSALCLLISLPSLLVSPLMVTMLVTLPSSWRVRRER